MEKPARGRTPPFRRIGRSPSTFLRARWTLVIFSPIATAEKSVARVRRRALLEHQPFAVTTGDINSMTDTPTAAASPAASKRKPGQKKGGGLSMAAIDLRVTKIKQMTDATKAKRVRRKLTHRILVGIAAGTVKDPAKAVQALLTLTPEKADAGGDDD
jgi:hypothetical protein